MVRIEQEEEEEVNANEQRMEKDDVKAIIEWNHRWWRRTVGGIHRGHCNATK